MVGAAAAAEVADGVDVAVAAIVVQPHAAAKLPAATAVFEARPAIVLRAVEVAVPGLLDAGAAAGALGVLEVGGAAPVVVAAVVAVIAAEV